MAGMVQLPLAPSREYKIRPTFIFFLETVRREQAACQKYELQVLPNELLFSSCNLIICTLAAFVPFLSLSGGARRCRLTRLTADGELLEQQELASPSDPPLPLRPSLSVPRTDFSRRPLPSAVPPSRTTSLPPSPASLFHPIALFIYFLYKTALCVSSPHRYYTR